MYADILFGPLDISYCIFFYILSSIGVLLGLVILIYPKILKNVKEIFFLLFLYFIFYLQNRILYNMCINNKPILEGAVDRIDFTGVELINKSGANVSKNIVIQLKNDDKVWNTQYPNIENNIIYIKSQLNDIYNNTKPLLYKKITT
jgi:hypothetical protein